MKTMRYVSLLIITLFAVASGAQAENRAAVNEVLKLKGAGLDEETIVAFVKNKNLNYDLSADDAIRLRDQGLSSSVLNAMLASGKDVSTPPTTLPPSISQTPGSAQPLPPPFGPPGIASQPAFSPDVAYFYQELDPYGHWIFAEDNQWCWQPAVVVGNAGWRPYWDQGHWVYTDHGWYWASDYPWGWAVFHYGRWHLHPHHGWIWFPDRVWGPAWVAWRTGGDYCGWAPLPPAAHYDAVAGNFLFRGRHVDVSFDFGLDWNHFNFCYLREIGERPRQHFHEEQEIRTIYNQTTVINNYTVVKAGNEGEKHAHIVNHGIDPARVAEVKGRPIEAVKIQDLRSPPPNRAHERLDARKKTLEVYRPKLAERGERGEHGEHGERGEHGRP